MMVNEGEFVLVGIGIFALGMLLIISPPVDSLFTSFTGYEGEKLQFIAITCLFVGASLAMAAMWSTKKA